MLPIQHLKASVLPALALLLLAGCASSPAEDSSDMSSLEPQVEEAEYHEEGVPGGVTIHKVELTATVQDINYDTREVTLASSSGETTTMTIGPEVVNFNNVEKGDKVHVIYYRQMVVYVQEDGAGVHEAGTSLLAGAPKGEKPAAVAADVQEVVAVVTAIDKEAHTATLKFPSGKEDTFPVRPDIELRDDQIGKKVVIQVTVAVGIKVDKI